MSNNMIYNYVTTIYLHNIIKRITEFSQQRSPGHQLGITLIDGFPP